MTKTYEKAIKIMPELRPCEGDDDSPGFVGRVDDGLDARELKVMLEKAGYSVACTVDNAGKKWLWVLAE